jgi:hypothetical protein
MTKTPTTQTYGELQRAYDHFNKALFGGRLPQALIIVARHKKFYGYFDSKRWHHADDSALRADEIALNCDHFDTRPIAETLSTLVHEMCHLEQYHFGKPSKNGYHNKEWGGMMRRVGLVPSATGKPGGAATGTRVSHYIEPGGPFMVAYAAIADKIGLAWRSQGTVDADKARKAKAASKTKYTCPGCATNAWAKPETRLVCGDCQLPLV